MTAIGVLCARVRVEEKQIIAAIGSAGFLAVPVPPAGAPLPPGPASPEFAMLGEILDATTGETMKKSIQVLVDRTPNRAVAAATLQLMQLYGVRTIDAGVAATGSRIQVATALAAAGIPRPTSLVGFSEESSNAGVAILGYPATLLGLTPGSSTTQLHDHDTADAVIEHRVVLGEQSEAIVLLQAGAPGADQRTIVHLVDGRAIAVDGAPTPPAGISIAEAAARTLGASLVAIELAETHDGTVVWDVLPVGEFRTARQLGEQSVADAIANLIAADQLVGSAREKHGIHNEEAQHGLALSA